MSEEISSPEIEHCARIDATPMLSRRWFHVSVIGFILVCSFSYGFIKGTAKQAHAYRQSGLVAFESASPGSPELVLPSGIVPFSVGEDARINNKSVSVVSFFSNRSVEELAAEQSASWNRANYRLLEKSSDRRAVIVGVDEGSGRRYSMVVWQVPPMIRRAVSNGYPVQGLISVAEQNEVGISSNDAEQGQVPGVPLPPGGAGGAVFSAIEPGGRSYSAMYTVPLSIDSAKGFYRHELVNGSAESGWKLVGSASNGGPSVGSSLGLEDEQAVEVPNVEQLQFIRYREEITLLFTDIPRRAGETNNEMSTLVTVIRAPRAGGV